MNRQHLETLRANANMAIKRHETVTIGGGQFKGAELETLAAALAQALNPAPVAPLVPPLLEALRACDTDAGAVALHSMDHARRRLAAINTIVREALVKASFGPKPEASRGN